MIIQNAVECKDGTIIKSGHRHEFMAHKDAFVDGGNDYIRRAGEFREDLSVSTKDSLDELKRKLVWGTYGKYGNQPLKYVRLIDCTTDHLHNIRGMILNMIENGMKTSHMTWIILAAIDLILIDREK